MDRVKGWKNEQQRYRWQRIGLKRSLMGDEEDREGMRSQIGWGGEYVKSIVYGGLDAIVTSFALVASVSGGNLPSGAVLVLGFANLIADGISMGFGDFLSTTTERNFAVNKQQNVDYDVKNDLYNQMVQLVETYESHGMERGDAETVVEVFAKYKDMLIEQKMTFQDNLLPPNEDESAWKNGLVTFVSFLGFGCTPLLTFVVLNPFTSNISLKFACACVVTALALIILGLAKARIAGERYLSSVLMVLSNGGLAAAAAYGISWLLNNVFGVDEP